MNEQTLYEILSKDKEQMSNDHEQTEINDIVIRERSAEIEKIENDTSNLAETFLLLKDHVENQGEILYDTEVYISSATESSRGGMVNLEQAEKHSTRSRWKLATFVSSVVVIVGAVTATAMLLKKGESPGT